MKLNGKFSFLLTIIVLYEIFLLVNCAHIKSHKKHTISSFKFGKVKTCQDIANSVNPTSTLQSCENVSYKNGIVSAQCFSKTKNKKIFSSISLENFILYDEAQFGMKWKSIPFINSNRFHLPTNCLLNEDKPYLLTCFSDKNPDLSSTIDLFDGLLNEDGKLIFNEYSTNYFHADIIGHFYKKCGQIQYDNISGNIFTSCAVNRNNKFETRTLNVNQCYGVEDCVFDGVDLICDDGLKKYNIIEFISLNKNNELECPKDCSDDFRQCQITKHSFQCNEQGKICENGNCELQKDKIPKPNKDCITGKCEQGKCEQEPIRPLPINPVLPEPDNKCKTGKCDDEPIVPPNLPTHPEDNNKCKNGKCEPEPDPNPKPDDCKTGNCEKEPIIPSPDYPILPEPTNNCKTGKCDPETEPNPNPIPEPEPNPNSIPEPEPKPNPNPTPDPIPDPIPNPVPKNCPLTNGQPISSFTFLYPLIVVPKCGQIDLGLCFPDFVTYSDCKKVNDSIQCNKNNKMITLEITKHIIYNNGELKCIFKEEKEKCTDYQYNPETSELSALCFSEKQKKKIKVAIIISKCEFYQENLKFQYIPDELRQYIFFVNDNLSCKEKKDIHCDFKYSIGNSKSIMAHCDEPSEDIEIDFSICKVNYDLSHCVIYYGEILVCFDQGKYNAYEIKNLFNIANINDISCNINYIQDNFEYEPSLEYYFYNICIDFSYDPLTNDIVALCPDVGQRNNYVEKRIHITSYLTTSSSFIKWKTIALPTTNHVNNIKLSYYNILLTNSESPSLDLFEKLYYKNGKLFIKTIPFCFAVDYVNGAFSFKCDGGINYNIRFDIGQCIDYDDHYYLHWKQSNNNNEYLSKANFNLYSGILISNNIQGNDIFDAIDITEGIEFNLETNTAECVNPSPIIEYKHDRSYIESCQRIEFNQESAMLSARCLNDKGDYIKTEINLGHCINEKGSWSISEIQSNEAIAYIRSECTFENGILLKCTDNNNIELNKGIVNHIGILQCKDENKAYPIREPCDKDDVNKNTTLSSPGCEGVTMKNSLLVSTCDKGKTQDELDLSLCIGDKELINCVIIPKPSSQGQQVVSCQTQQNKNKFISYALNSLVKVENNKFVCISTQKFDRLALTLNVKINSVFNACEYIWYEPNTMTLKASCFDSTGKEVKSEIYIGDLITIINGLTLKWREPSDPIIEGSQFLSITFINGYLLKLGNSELNLYDILIVVDGKLTSPNSQTIYQSITNIDIQVTKFIKSTIYLNTNEIDINDCLRYDNSNGIMLKPEGVDSIDNIMDHFSTCFITSTNYLVCEEKQNPNHYSMLNLKEIMFFNQISNKYQCLRPSSSNNNIKNYCRGVYQKENTFTGTCYHKKEVKYISTNLSLSDCKSFTNKNVYEILKISKGNIVCRDPIKPYSKIKSFTQIEINSMTIINNNIIVTPYGKLDIVSCAQEKSGLQYDECYISENYIICFNKKQSFYSAFYLNSLLRIENNIVQCRHAKSLTQSTIEEESFITSCNQYNYDDSEGLFVALCLNPIDGKMQYSEFKVIEYIIRERDEIKLNIKRENSLNGDFLKMLQLYQGHSFKYKNSSIYILSRLSVKNGKVKFNMEFEKSALRSDIVIDQGSTVCEFGGYVHNKEEAKIALKCPFDSTSPNYSTFDLSQCIKYDDNNKMMVISNNGKQLSPYIIYYDTCEVSHNFVICFDGKTNSYSTISLAKVLHYNKNLNQIECLKESKKESTFFNLCSQIIYKNGVISAICENENKSQNVSINISEYLTLLFETTININPSLCFLTSSMELVCEVVNEDGEQTKKSISLFTNLVLINGILKLKINDVVYPEESPLVVKIESNTNIYITNNIIHINGDSLNVLSCVNTGKIKYTKCEFADGIVSCLTAEEYYSAFEISSIFKMLNGKLVCDTSNAFLNNSDNDEEEDLNLISVYFFKRCPLYKYDSKKGILIAKCFDKDPSLPFKVIEINIINNISIINNNKLIWKPSYFNTVTISEHFTQINIVSIILDRGLYLKCTNCKEGITFLKKIFYFNGILLITNKNTNKNLKDQCNVDIEGNYPVCYRFKTSVMCEKEDNKLDIFGCDKNNYGDYLNECKNVEFNEKGYLTGECLTPNSGTLISSVNVINYFIELKKNSLENCKLEKGHELICVNQKGEVIPIDIYDYVYNFEGTIKIGIKTNINISLLKGITNTLVNVVSKEVIVKEKDILSSCKDFSITADNMLKSNCKNEKNFYSNTHISLYALLPEKDQNLIKDMKCYLHILNRGIYVSCEIEQRNFIMINLNEKIVNLKGQFIKKEQIIKKSENNVYESIFSRCEQYLFDENTNKLTAFCYNGRNELIKSYLSLHESITINNNLLSWLKSCEDNNKRQIKGGELDLFEGRYLSMKSITNKLDIFSAIYSYDGKIVIPQEKEKTQKNKLALSIGQGDNFSLGPSQEKTKKDDDNKKKEEENQKKDEENIKKEEENKNKDEDNNNKNGDNHKDEPPAPSVQQIPGFHYMGQEWKDLHRGLFTC